ncbi:MAG: hypothetical protein ABL961_04920 [Vicinamibacterales bacterium]
MRIRRVALAVFICVALSVAHVTAQTEASSINPEAVEFETPVLSIAGITGYRVELFVAGADPTSDRPVNTMELGAGALRSDGRLRVELKTLIFDIPDGRYVATVRAMTATRSEQSAPSEAFVLSRAETVDDRIATAKRERIWTKVGLAIAGGLLVIPVLVR